MSRDAMFFTRWRHALVAWLGLFSMLGATIAAEREPLKLTRDASVAHVWPHIGLLADEKKTLTIEQAIAALPSFKAPESKNSTLGV
ncbi:MAG: hypothetical protein ACRCWJ_19475, partial [Casimicrobium sp.]